MSMNRRQALLGVAALAWPAGFAMAGDNISAMAPAEVLHSWYRIVLKLVRHTPTYSPPVASRSLAYLGVTVFEAVASGSQTLQSLAGQLNGLQPVPRREAGRTYSEALVLHAAMAFAVRNFFSNTGPTGQRVMAAVETKLQAGVSTGLPAEVVTRSEAYGRAIAAHILAWSQDDGGAVIDNMGFPQAFELTAGPAHWIPTSLTAQQQTPLLPNWGKNRTFALASGAACPLPPPPPYSEDKNSEFYRQAWEVYDTVRAITPEQRAIARFWSDDPMLSPTPPGHWMSIALTILARDGVALDQSADVLMRVGVAVADSFIACWHSKFEYDLLRPVTYIRRVIDPQWEPILITPPFPEYPSGHSTQSGAAAAVLTAIFGNDHGFADATHERDGLAPRTYPNFWAAAEEAGISRLYGGIHFRAAIERGLEQGRCVAASVIALRTRK